MNMNKCISEENEYTRNDILRFISGKDIITFRYFNNGMFVDVDYPTPIYRDGIAIVDNGIDVDYDYGADEWYHRYIGICIKKSGITDIINSMSNNFKNGKSVPDGTEYMFNNVPAVVYKGINIYTHDSEEITDITLTVKVISMYHHYEELFNR